MYVTGKSPQGLTNAFHCLWDPFEYAKSPYSGLPIETSGAREKGEAGGETVIWQARGRCGNIAAEVSICFNPFMGNPSWLEWPASLDVSSLLDEGWRPFPFREFIVKVHSRCDLSCDYCYMYEMADQSWRGRPRAMSAETAELTARRIADHANTHGLPDLTLILHGGEPLLAGRDLISQLVTSTRRLAGPKTTVHASVQTNGVGLSDSYLELFDELGVRVGVSVDGDADAHDRHRRFPSGRGSYQAVAAALGRLQRFPHLYGGLLCTVDLGNDP